MRIRYKTNLRFYLIFLLIISGPTLSYGQEDTEKEKLNEYNAEVRQLVSFLQFSMNVLGDPTVSAKDKDVIINESYLKIFKDEKVQIEDDLDENRDVVTNKDVQAYLKDVDFFFKQVKFEFNIIDIANDVNQEGQLFFTIKMMRNLKGITIEDDSIDSDQERYIEVNVDEEKKDIKIASIYTTKLSRNEELTYWWAGLDDEWKTFLGVDIEVKAGLRLNEIKEFSDSTYVVDDQQIVDSIKIIDFVKKAAGKNEINLSGSKVITDLKPLDQLKDLRILNISSSDIIDLFPIRNLTTIEILDCSNTMINDLNPLKYSKSLRELYINNTPVTSITVIENFENLELLQLEQTVIDSLPSIDRLIHLKELNCSSTNLVSLDSIKYLKSLINLNFSNTSVDDLEPISQLKNLKKITFNKTNVEILAPLQGMENLEKIIFENTEVDNLMALKDLENLKIIYADETKIDLNDFVEFNKARPEVDIVFMTEDLFAFWEGLDEPWEDIINQKLNLSDSISKEQIHQILKINEIEISGNKDITHIEPVEFMPNLQVLNFTATQVSDLSPIKNLQNLHILNGANSMVKDLSPLKNLTALKAINFDNTEVADISVISELSQIDSLFFNNTKVKDISALNDLSRFNAAYFEQTQVTDEDFNRLNFNEDSSVVIYKTDKLRAWWGNLGDEWQNIFKESNNLTGRPSTEELHQLTSKKDLAVKSIKLNNLDPVPEFTRLKSLSFTDSQITSLYPLVSLKKLEELTCPRNPISDIEALSTHTQLRILNLDNTQISDLKPIRSLKELRELKISGTNVKDLSAVSGFEKLEVLDFSKTKIKKIKPLSGLYNLKVLKCYNNKISPKKVEEFKAKNPNCDVVFY